MENTQEVVEITVRDVTSEMKVLPVETVVCDVSFIPAKTKVEMPPPLMRPKKVVRNKCWCGAKTIEVLVRDSMEEDKRAQKRKADQIEFKNEPCKRMDVKIIASPVMIP